MELCTELLYAPYLVSMLLADLLSLHLVTFLFSSCHFFSSRCMLELKFAILYRAASPLTGFLCSIVWRIIGFLQTLPAVAHQLYF